MNDWNESEELTDEEKMMNLLETLQKENEDLRQQLHHQPQPQSMEPLLKTIRQQEQEIGRLNSSLIEEQSQNERLLELAKNEKKLNEENRSLQNKLNVLQNDLNLKNAQLSKLSTQVVDFESKFENLPSKSTIDDFADSYNTAIRSMKGLWIVNILNWTVVGVFGLLVILNGWFLWKTYNTSKDTLTTATQTNNAIYNQEGYSVLSGARASKDALAADQNSPR